MSGVQRIGGRDSRGTSSGSTAGHQRAPRSRFTFGAFGVPLIVALLTVAVIVASCFATGIAYHLYTYGRPGRYGAYAAIGTLVALLNVLPYAFRNELGPDRALAPRPRIGQILLIWTWAFFAVAVIAFLTKSTATFSRGWLVLFYVCGGGALVLLEFAIRAGARRALQAGRMKRQRLMLIGTPEDIHRFSAAHAALRTTTELVSVAVISPAAFVASGESGRALMRDQLERAVVSARTQDIDGIVLLCDLTQTDFIDTCVAAFSMVPVSIHVDAGRLVQRFGSIKVERIGPIAALGITAAPLGPMQAMSKRLFDVVASACALVLLAGVLAAVAIMIKRDSPGPVLFRQRRLGYNQRVFWIYKFRSMTVQDDGDRVPQAVCNDPRVTPVGRLLRRYNIDELPQLINVLKGEMSIVGPRPHAVAHDRLFEKRIDMYPRRLNVRPGITGWAQVHGHRGETDTDAKMAARVEHDMYYIDHWSLWLDLYIIALTVLSPKAYRNAV